MNRHGADSDGEAKQHEIIESRWRWTGCRCWNSPKSIGWREKPRKPVVAAGHRAPLECDVVKHLAEGDRHHGEIDAAPPHDQRAENRAGRRRRAACRATSASGVLGARNLSVKPGAVGAKPEICGMAERQHAGKAEQEIQRHRRQPEHQHAGGERGVAAERHHPVGAQQKRRPDRRERRSACVRSLGAHVIMPSSPSSPRGRTRSTTAIIT